MSHQLASLSVWPATVAIREKFAKKNISYQTRLLTAACSAIIVIIILAPVVCPRSTQAPLLTLHALVPENTPVHDVLEDIKAVLNNTFGIDHSTIQVETGPCPDDH